MCEPVNYNLFKKNWTECYIKKKLDALAQSGFVYTSYAAATVDMGMHVSGYVAGGWQNGYSIDNTNIS